jgi:hypothetical protein
MFEAISIILLFLIVFLLFGVVWVLENIYNILKSLGENNG